MKTVTVEVNASLRLTKKVEVTDQQLARIKELIQEGDLNLGKLKNINESEGDIFEDLVFWIEHLPESPSSADLRDTFPDDFEIYTA